jgi:hypothetical protein
MRSHLFLSLPLLLGTGLLRADEPMGPTATLTGHAKRVTSLAVSPDGATLASGSYDRTVQLWDVATGKVRATLQGHAGEVDCLAFAPDGRTLASGSSDETVKLWDPARGRELGTLRGVQGFVRSLAFSPDSRTLASGGQDGTIKLWDAAAAKERTAFAGDKDYVRGLAFTPDGKTLVSASAQRAILWDVTTGKQRATLQGRDYVVTSLALSPDGRTLALGNYADSVQLWEMATCKERATLTGQPGAVYSVAFAPGGRTLACGGGEPALKLWDVLTSKEARTLPGHHSSVHSLTFTPDGRALASGGHDGAVKLWAVSGWDQTEQRQPPLSPEALQGRWADLAAEDAKKSFQALGILVAVPRQTVTFLGEQLRPAVPLTQSLAQWVSDLDDDDFAVREKATEHIRGLGSAAEPALRKALQGRPSLEVRRRVEFLLDHLLKGALTPEQLREVRAVETLEYIATPEAKKVLTHLAEGEPEARLTREAKASLGRLSRPGD